MSVSLETEKMLAISALPGVGTMTLLTLLNLSEFPELSTKELISYIPFLKKRASPESLKKALDFSKKNIDEALKRGHTIVSIFDKKYPNSLKRIPDAPPILFCAGDISFLQDKCLAVIGTREPTEHGKLITKKITSWFTENNWNIVSGLALGIDSLAHEVCLNSTAKTAAVLAHGLEKIYPATNRKLAESIIEKNGALISEYPYFSATFKANFVQRDRIQAALSAAVILIQSDVTGGSLHASKSALKYGRYLVVAGQSETDIRNSEPKIKGNMKLLYGNTHEIYEIFKDKLIDTARILKLFTKENYQEIEDEINKNSWWN
ncbi:DNA-processing protein DprA [Pseudomonas aeruginosa]|uniref:DNA-processing protein DprA n=1 Tax=Pseudomonas aeruginosa TaxID=287 RepID=UPI0031CF2825